MNVQDKVNQLTFNELDLAEKLYLFEYINLMFYGINPNSMTSRN